MAKMMNFTSSIGLEFENAYFKIDEYSCDKEENISARCRAYVSRELSKSGASPIEGSEDVILLPGDYSDRALNAKKQIYGYMSKLDKYKDAVDVLE